MKYKGLRDCSLALCMSINIFLCGPQEGSQLCATGSLHLRDDSTSSGDKCRIPENITETDGFKKPHPSCKALVQQVVNQTPSPLAAPAGQSSQDPETGGAPGVLTWHGLEPRGTETRPRPLSASSIGSFSRNEIHIYKPKHSLATKTRNELSSASCAPGNCSS